MSSNFDLIIFIMFFILIFLSPTLIKMLSRKLLNRQIETSNPISENFKDDRIGEELMSAKAQLEGTMRGPG